MIYNPSKFQSLFDEAIASDCMFYKKGSFEDLCFIFRDPRNIEITYKPVRYTTLTKEEYSRFDKECCKPWCMNNPNIVIFQDKDGSAAFGLWEPEPEELDDLTQKKIQAIEKLIEKVSIDELNHRTPKSEKYDNLEWEIK